MLSLIIPARNNVPLTRDCIKSALHSLNTLNLKCQIILIDDLSDPAEGMLDLFRQMRELGKSAHEFTLVRTAQHEHYTGVFSLGLSLAVREHAFFLSNDMLITPSFFAATIAVGGLSREIGIVRGTSPYTDAMPEHVVPLPASAVNYGGVAAFSKEVFDRSGLLFVEDSTLSGDAVLIKRPVIDAIGVMDTRFFGYFGDSDYGMRAQLAGFRLVCAKGAWLFHSGRGHIITEVDARSSRTGEPRDSLHQQVIDRRLALASAAYDAFRAKWGPDVPEEFVAEHTVRQFQAIARKNASRVALKFDLPPEALRRVERH